MRQLVDHVTRHAHGDGDEGLVLAKSDGIGLIARCAIPLLEKNTETARTKVVYARGCDPYRDPDAWQEARRIMGADDDLVILPITAELAAAVQAAAATGEPLRFAVRPERLGIIDNAAARDTPAPSEPTQGTATDRPATRAGRRAT